MTNYKTCKNCRCVMADHAMFCPECGVAVSVEEMIPVYTPPAPPTHVPVPVPAPVPVHRVVFCPECGAKTTSEFQFCPECGTTISQTRPEKSGRKKMELKGKPLFIGIGAVAVALIVILAIIFLGGGSEKSYLIYAKDRELQITNMQDASAFELTERFSGGNTLSANDFSQRYRYVLFSGDGRYIFYPDRVSGAGDGVTYYWRDLSADNTKSGAANRIDSEITGIPSLSNDGGKLFYIKGDDSKLYVYDRKSGEKSKLDDEVRSFFVSDAGDYLVYHKNIEGEYSIYEINLRGIDGEKNKIDSNSTIQSAIVNEKKLYYLKDGTLYFKEAGKEKAKISSNVTSVVSIVNGDSVYYAKTDEITGVLSNYVEDDMEDDDKNLTEPAEPKYPEEPKYPNSSDYQHEVWYDDIYGDETNPETGERGYWRTETDYDAYYDAQDRYEDEYRTYEDEYDRLRGEYNSAMSKYEGKTFRDDLREALTNEDNAVTLDEISLYYWTRGTETLVAAGLYAGYNSGAPDILAASPKMPLVLYQKYNVTETGKKKLSELLSSSDGYFYIDGVLYDIRQAILETRSLSDEVYAAVQERELAIACSDAQGWEISDKGTIYFLDDYDYNDGYGVLKSVSLEGEKLSTPFTIDDEVAGFVFGNGTDTVYYGRDINNGSGDFYSDGKLLASDAYFANIYNFNGTDTFLYFKDYSEKNKTGTLTILRGGNETKIADDVGGFVAVDEKNVAYLADYSISREKGDLMLYNGGGKPVTLDTDVTALLWNPKMIWGLM